MKKKDSSLMMGETTFEEDLVKLQPNMYSYALSLTADRLNAEDLMQETSLRVLDNREKFKANTNFKGWVFTVMRNLFINDYHRGVRTRNIVDETADYTLVGQEVDTADLGTPEHDYSLFEINKAIDKLDEIYREPFMLHLSGFKYTEISEKLDLALGTVKSRIFFARKQLQSDLEEFRR